MDKARYHTLMAYRPLKSFFPTADELLAADLPQLGESLLVHLKGYEGGGGSSIWGNGLFSQHNFESTQTPGYGQKPEYGDRQPEVNQALMEAWSWLEAEGMLIRDPSQVGWFRISREGNDLIRRFELRQKWEMFGVERVKDDLIKGGLHVLDVGRPAQQRAWAEEWVRMKEGQAVLPAGKKRAGSSSGSLFIADSRIDELRKLSCQDFDFQKLIRLCEELNSSYDNGNYYATAMLTRGILDHVPPLFGHTRFTEVANNYSGGGRSFKEHMQHLEGSARKVSDGHLHMPIRKSESLPKPQQVWCGQELDALLSEIVRIMK